MFSRTELKDLNCCMYSWYNVEENKDVPFDATTYFSYAHHAETWDKDKHYENEITMDFGKGLHSYKQHYEIIGIDDHGSNTEQIFVVAEEVLSDEDRIALSPWCQCRRCQIKWYTPWKAWGLCRCCIGCLNQDWNMAQSIIDRARQYKIGHPTPPKRHEELKELLAWIFSPFGIMIGIGALIFLLIDFFF